ncbi:methylase of polypeptide subunit release factors [Catenulispora sp. GAS73]|uniref:Eco57I restriction-modification methylase domain-containing protein n=1 Tax=Catenulispora sp. GAS73 TaxID=3156269 RepID=UPI0035187EF7
MTTRNAVTTAVHTVGGLLPADMLRRIADSRDRDLKGTTAGDYHIALRGVTVQDEAARHWSYLKGVWQALRDQLGRDAADPTGIAIQQWLLPLFTELGYGRLTPLGATNLISNDTTRVFQISHRWEHVPIQLIGWGTDADRRIDGVTGAAGTAPQSQMQELLNRSSAHLWGLLSNGKVLRLLRDSTSLIGASYVEFDLEAIFDGELFSDFVLLYRLLHVSRFELRENSESAASCWLETWRNAAINDGTRALEQLRVGVKKAIEALGTGFLSDPDNTDLRDNLNVRDFHHALLRLVYRLLFLFVAEDRDVLIPADADPVARQRYEKYYSTARLRRTARRVRGSAHSDLWEALLLVLRGVGQEGGLPQLGLPALGGIFEDTEDDRPLTNAWLGNEPLLEAIRALSVVHDTTAKRNRVVDYRHLGAEELGSVYESLLESVPRHDPSSREFTLAELAGNARKITGSYYTPSALIEVLLESALDPVLDAAQKCGEQNGDIEAELLKVTVCDPACGSGHFLVAAARRIAKRLAAVREGSPEPTIEATRHALREVAARSIYGVDLNPMAVELAKVSLWLEALEPGKPLGFLDAHIKHGNSLLGVTPKLLADGIPDTAFTAIEGDDKKFVTQLKKLNARERSGQHTLFDIDEGIKVTNAGFARGFRSITGGPAETLRDVHLQSSKFRALEQSPEYLHARNVADAWCAAFVWKKTPDAPEPITHGKLMALEDVESVGIPQASSDEVVRLSEEYKFFHWHLEFPEIFEVSGSSEVDPQTGWSGGFSCVLGNPPWERIKLQEQEFFATRDVEVATAPNAAARQRLIAGLANDRPELFGEFSAAKRRAEGESHVVRKSDRYPLTGRGDINTYAIFGEVARSVICPTGRCGMVLPSGIATDATTAPFIEKIIASSQLIHVYGFRNNKGLFRGVGHGDVRFCLFAFAGLDSPIPEARFAFDIGIPDELSQGDRVYSLSPREIRLLNPNTGTCPTFKTRRDADITLDIYRRFPVLFRESDHSNPWGIAFLRMFDMSTDSSRFRTRDELERDGWDLSGSAFIRDVEEMIPLYEAKMVSIFDFRFGDYRNRSTERVDSVLPRASAAEKSDPEFSVLPRYWIPKADLDLRLAEKGWLDPWFLGWRDVCRATDERTLITMAVPRVAVGHKFMLITTKDRAHFLQSVLSSFACDYVVRQKISGLSLGYFIFNQIAAPPPEEIDAIFVTPRVLELVYTAFAMEPFANDLGDTGAPFRWDEERRFRLRAELDAGFFHLYGIKRDDVNYIMETFPLVKRNDEATYGTFRTKDLILEVYDAMAASIATGTVYQTILDPPPGEGPRHPVRH